MQIDSSHSTDDLASLASIIVKLNTDLNAVQAVLREADKALDKKDEEIKELKKELDSLRDLVLSLDNSAKPAMLKGQSLLPPPAASGRENPSYPDIP